jgi:hypothetical protein
MYSSSAIENDFDHIVRNLLAQGVDRKIIVSLVENQIKDTIEHNKRSVHVSPVELKRSIIEKLLTLKGLMNACDLLQDEPMAHTLVRYVISNPNLYPASDLGPLMVEAKTLIKDNPLSCYALLRDHVIQGIRQELDKGVRDPQDWSIEVQLNCPCDLCKTTAAFLQSKTASTQIWAIVAHDREHVMAVLSRFGLPVTLSVEKKGSPHKLIMVKSDTLYQTAKERFDRLSEIMKSLEA